MISAADLLRPVPEEALPDLREHMYTASRYMSLSVAAVAPFGVVATSWQHASSFRDVALMAAVNSVVFLSVALLSTSPLGKRRPDVTILVFAFAMGAMQMLAGVPMANHENPVPYLPLMVPITVAMFAPWKPTLSLILTALLGVAWALTFTFIGDNGLQTGASFVALGLSGGMAALSNQMSRLLWARLQAAYRMAGMYDLGCMTAGIAHEVKTPLAASMSALKTTQGLVDELEASAGNPDVGADDLRGIATDMRASVTLATDANSRISAHILAIREHTRSMNTVECVPVAVPKTIDSVLTLMSHRLKGRNLRFDTTAVAAGVAIEGDPGKLSQILSNLIGNALDACIESGLGTTVYLSAEREGALVVVAVEDDGPGVPPGMADRVFLPLFTTRTTKDGTGLGLSIARNLSEGAFHGRLSLEPPQRTTRGARFVLRCPARGNTAHATGAWAPGGLAAS